MPRGYSPSKKDSNQLSGEKAFIKAGWSVSDTHAVGCRLLKDGTAIGALDNFVAKYDVTILVEWKVGKSKLNPAETVFYDNWRGEKIIGRTPEQAIADCEKILEKYIPF